MQGRMGVLGSRVSDHVFGFYAAVLIANGCIAAVPQITAQNKAEYAAQVINPKWAGGLITPRSMSVLLWGSDGAVSLFRNGAGWRSAATPIDLDLASVSSDDEGRVFVGVGEHGVIIRSDNGGSEWRLASLETLNTDLHTVAYHSRTRAWLAAGGSGVILRSIDAGKSWKALQTGLDLTFRTIYVDPRSNDVFMGGDAGLVGLSSDGGATWSLGKVDMPSPATPINAFRWCGSRLIATSALGRIAVSDNAGREWSVMSTGTNAFFTGSAWDSRRNALVMTSHTGDVFRSVDECKTWERIDAQLGETKNYLSAIRYNERDESLLAVGYHGIVLRSIDGGQRWQKVESGVQVDLESLVHDAQGKRDIVFGDGGLIAQSTDSGKHWKTVTPALNLYLREVVSVPNSNVVVASGELGGIVRSEDGGRHWRLVDVSYPDMNTPPNLRALVIEPRGGALIAAGAPGTVIRSSDQGRTWSIQHWTPLGAGEAFPWSFVDTRRKKVFVLEAHGLVYGSQDGGLHWQSTAARTDHELWHASSIPRAGIYLAAGQAGAMVRSDDAGQSWSPVTTPHSDDLFGSFADEATQSFFVVGANGTLLRSTDRGLSWSKIDTGTSHALRRMMRDSRTGALIVFGEKGVMLRSEDGGNTWQSVATNTNAELRKGLHEQQSGSFIVFGQQGVVLRSTDAGKTWARLPSHTRRPFRSAAINERNGDIIAVGERIVRFQRRPPTSN